MNKLGALAFGAELPNGKQAFPTSPSWMLYGGDDAHCLDNVPVLIRPETFCSVFTAEARVFRRVPSRTLPVRSATGRKCSAPAAMRPSRVIRHAPPCMLQDVRVWRTMERG